MKSKKHTAASFLLVFFSIAFVFIISEALFPFFLVYLPLKTRWYLDEGIRVLAQYSKKSVVPEHYIALLGDSYAAGQGDWFLSVNKNGRPAFHSAHLLHKETAKDVITFGAAGAGSLRGLVGEPLAQYRFINASYRFEMDPPEYIIAYFYEGNDLNDNLEYLRLSFPNGFDPEKIYDPAFFATFIQRVVHWGDPLFRKAKFPGIRDQLIFTPFLGRLLDAFYHEAIGTGPNLASTSPWPLGNMNKVLIDGKSVRIPDMLQSPALELTGEEIDLSVYIVEQSLRYLKSVFSSAKIGIVYIPSPLASYTLDSQYVSIQVYEKRKVIYAAETVQRRSDDIAERIGAVAARCEVDFMDARPFIRKRSSGLLVHGPVDWKHFNKEGYSALAEAVVQLIRKMSPGPTEKR